MKKPQNLYSFNERELVPFESKYLERVKRWRNTQISALRQIYPLTDYDQENWYPQAIEDEKQVLFGIIYERDQEWCFIGYTGLVNLDYQNRRGEVSFLVNPERAEEKSVYREDFLSTLFMLSRYAFEELSLNKIYAETFEFRKEHMEVLEEFGFQLDGKLREHQFTKGEFQDSYIHSLLAEEWRDNREEIKLAVEK